MLKENQSTKLKYKKALIKRQSNSRPAKAILPAKIDAGRQVKYNVQPDWSNQIITIYLIGQFKPMKWYDIISLSAAIPSLSIQFQPFPSSLTYYGYFPCASIY